MKFQFPGHDSRVTITGATGSGKTRFGNWLFSYSAFHKRPYVIIDYKGDDLIEQIERARTITLNEIPKHPGLYVLRPRPDEAEKMEAWLWKVWERGNIGLFFDEGYMVPNKGALNSILTQGRSKRIPTMILTQRPTYCSRFVFSEAGYFAIFRLNDKRDYETIQGFTPRNEAFDFDIRLPAYTARWYDVGRDYSAIIDPVPGDDYILDRFDDLLRTKHKGI